MTSFDESTQPYNYYPNTAITLSHIAYSLIMDLIPAEVQMQTNLEVCWGPAELVDDLGISYSRMFIARNGSTNEYFVVIRGTFTPSLISWIKEDFDIGSSQLVANLPGNPPGIPTTAIISQGAFNGVSDLLKLIDRKTGQSALAYLSSVKPGKIYVTGHSLGGTLAPVLFVYLNSMLYGGGYVKNMALWTFAGLTAGGPGFNDYFNSIINTGFKWRIQNSLDVAPFLFDSLAGAKDIYKSHGLECSIGDALLLDGLFALGWSSGVMYAQPQAGFVMQGQFQSGLSWSDEGSAQHHSSPTYMDLVKANFPL